MFKKNMKINRSFLVSFAAFVVTLLVSGTVRAQDACLTLVDTTDPAGHSCCINPPSDNVEISTANDGTVTLIIQDVAYSPLVGTLDNGQVFLQHTGTVAGIGNVESFFEGALKDDILSGIIVVGTNGVLPQEQTIVFDVSIDLMCGVSGACPGRYSNGVLSIDIENDLTGTVEGADGLTGNVYGKYKYNDSQSLCYIAAFVDLDGCDIVLAGFLEEDEGEGHFNFGGGNSCVGVMDPLSFTLPKIE